MIIESPTASYPANAAAVQLCQPFAHQTAYFRLVRPQTLMQRGELRFSEPGHVVPAFDDLDLAAAEQFLA